MGYNTDFMGVLEFNKPLTPEQENYLVSFMGEDCREHPEWGPASRHLTWMDIEITDDGMGIRWNGSEKTYNMVEKINLILDKMREQWPEFTLFGQLEAQGELPDDRWVLSMTGEEGHAIRLEVPTVGDEVTCPHCKQSFRLEGKERK